jgi:hypothetical protein
MIVRSRITLIIALLFAITLISWCLGHGFDNIPSRIATTLVILIAAIKIRFVMLDFMEIRTAPWLLRAFCETWIAGLALIIITLHILGTT